MRTEPSAPGDNLRIETFHPAFGVVGDIVEISGVNFSGESNVTFGGVEAFLELRTTTFIRAVVPENIAGRVTLKVQGSGNLPFRALPMLGELTEGVAGLENASRTVKGLGTHLGSSPTIVYSAVRGGSFAPGDPEFKVTLPQGVSAGYLRLEVDGFHTASFFVRSDRALATAP